MIFFKEDDFVKPSRSVEIEKFLSEVVLRPGGTLDEHEVYDFLENIGIAAPARCFYDAGADTDSIETKLPHAGPFVAKIVVEGVTHKTEHGGIAFNITKDKASDAIRHFAGASHHGKFKGVLFVEQIPHDMQPGGEMILGLYEDPFFGPCVGLGFGGTQTERLKEIMRPEHAQVFLPASIDIDSVDHILRNMPVVQFLEGKVRGSRHKIAYSEIAAALKELGAIGRYYSRTNPKAPFVIEELEMNPAIAHEGKIVALDGVLRAARAGEATVQKKPIHKIKNLLLPKTVAIAGASGKNPSNFGNIILKKFIKGGVRREDIFLIHPKENEIDGIKCHKDLKTMLAARGGEPVDCLVIGVPAKIAHLMIAEAFEIGAAHAIQIITAGFGETKAGKGMQDELSTKLALLNGDEKRPVVNGPNTMGNLCGSIDTRFTARYKSSDTGRGKTNVSLICQSGAYMITRISDLADVVSPKTAISVGNQMDLSVTDFFEHLLNEEGVDVYGLYIEGLNPGDGTRLMRLIDKVMNEGRFVVIYKAGRTKAGMEAAKGHTAAMAGDYEMFRHLMRRAGAMVADTFDEFDDLLMLTAYSPGLKNLTKIPERRLGIAALSNAGFEKCAIADHLTSLNPKTIEIARFSETTQKKIGEIFAEHGNAGVVDVHEILDLSPMMNDEGYEKIIRTTLADENVDFGIYSIVPETVMLNTCESAENHREDFNREGSILNRLIAIRQGVKKPFVVSFESGPKYNGLRRRLMGAGIPVFESADAAARAVAKCLDAIRKDVD